MWLVLALVVLIVPNVSQAENKIITSEGTYTMGDGETPYFAESMALQKAKQTALEQAGIYIQSYTKTNNQDLTADEVQTVAGGVLEIEVLDRTRTLAGAGLQFSVKIKAVVSPDKVETLVGKVRGKSVSQEYKDLVHKYDALAQEISALKQSLASSSQIPERESAIEQIREREQSFIELQHKESNFFASLLSGEQLLAQAKQSLALSDSIVNAFLRSGVRVDMKEIRSVINREKGGFIDLTIPVSGTMPKEVWLILREYNKAEHGTEERVTVEDSDFLETLSGFSSWKNPKSKRGYLKTHLSGTLFTFSYRQGLQEELWHLRDRLGRLSIIVDLRNEEERFLARCSTDYREFGFLSVGDTWLDEKIDSKWLIETDKKFESPGSMFREQILTSPENFGPDYQLYSELTERYDKFIEAEREKFKGKEITDEVLINWQATMPKDMQEIPLKLKNLESKALERFFQINGPPVKLRKVEKAYNSSWISGTYKDYERPKEPFQMLPTILAIDEEGVRTYKGTLREATVSRIKKIEARLVLHDRDWLDKRAERVVKEAISGVRVLTPECVEANQ